jgi:hypothetical protein
MRSNVPDVCRGAGTGVSFSATFGHSAHLYGSLHACPGLSPHVVSEVVIGETFQSHISVDECPTFLCFGLYS